MHYTTLTMTLYDRRRPGSGSHPSKLIVRNLRNTDQENCRLFIKKALNTRQITPQCQGEEENLSLCSHTVCLNSYAKNFFKSCPKNFSFVTHQKWRPSDASAGGVPLTSSCKLNRKHQRSVSLTIYMVLEKVVLVLLVEFALPQSPSP